MTFSCTEVKKQVTEDMKTELMQKVKVELVSSLTNPTVDEDENGNIFIIQDETAFTLYKDRFFIGEIDDDSESDLLYSIAINNGGNVEELIHAVWLSTTKKEMEFKLESNRSIVGIENKKILVDEYQWAENDPRSTPSIVNKKTYEFIGNKIVESN